MAVYNKATRTAKGRAYDASVNADEFQSQYSFMYISSHDYTAADVDALTEIEDIVIKAGVNDVKKNSDVAVSIYAPYTNAGRTTSFELRTIGLIATHPTDGLILHSIVTASVPDTVPEDDGANLVDETFQFILEEVNADNTLLKGDPSGLINVNIFNQFVNQTGDTFVTINNTLDSKVDRMDKAEYFNIPLQTGVKPAYQAVYWISQTGEFGIVFNTISTAAVKTGTALGFLPEGARPAVRTPVPGSMNINNSTRLSCSIDILPNGQMLLVYAGDAIVAGNTWDVVVPPVYIPIGG